MRNPAAAADRCTSSSDWRSLPAAARAIQCGDPPPKLAAALPEIAALKIKCGDQQAHLASAIQRVPLGAADSPEQVSTLLVVPVAPHWAEEVWTAKLGRPGCIITAGWPAAAEPDMVLQVRGYGHVNARHRGFCAGRCITAVAACVCIPHAVRRRGKLVYHTRCAENNESDAGQASSVYLEKEIIPSMRSMIQKAQAPVKGKKGAAAQPPPKVTVCIVLL